MKQLIISPDMSPIIVVSACGESTGCDKEHIVYNWQYFFAKNADIQIKTGILEA